MARLEVITGPMFTYKTSEVITRIKSIARFTEKRVLVVKPKLDTRPTRDIFKEIKKDKDLKEYSLLHTSIISSMGELINMVKNHKPQVLAIDEIHFFEEWLVDAVKELLEMHIEGDFTIIVAGLDMDYLEGVFNVTAQLMGMANDVSKRTTTCFKCKKAFTANLTYKRPGGSDNIIEIGDSELYEARCPKCHRLPK